MLVIDVAFLQGTYDACDPLVGQDEPEWPPAPARLFAGLVAGAYAAGMSSERRAALAWLEALPPPLIDASRSHHRQVGDTYVPVADAYGWEPNLEHLPDRLLRQPRMFPRVVPEVPAVRFRWKTVEVDEQVLAHLKVAAAFMPCLGRSTTPVATRVHEEPGDARDPVDARETWHPADERSSHAATIRVRTPAPGYLAALDLHHEDRRTPARAAVVRYQRGAPAGPEEDAGAQPFVGPFGDLLVFARKQGPRVPSELTLDVTQALRSAVLSRSSQPSPPVLTGHGPNGAPVPHCAYLALPFVGSQHADGRLLAVAVAVPRASEAELREVATALVAPDHQLERLTLGSRGDWTLQRVLPEAGDGVARGAEQAHWVGPSRSWATVTPIVLGHHPDHRKPSEERAAEIEDIVAYSCVVAGYPEPRRVSFVAGSAVRGAPAARSFRTRRRVGETQRLTAHAVIEFDQPVLGPVLLGALRYFGLGLCLPVSDAWEVENER